MPFKIKEVDREFYQDQLKGFLPNDIIDIHTHVWLDRMVSDNSKKKSKIAMWPFKVAKDNPIEDLINTYKLIFPNKKITPLIFSNILDKDNLDQMNEYILHCAIKYNFPALAVTRPDWKAEKINKLLKNNGFLGIKPYLTFSADSIPVDKIEIFDFLPHHQLKVLNEFDAMVILHIARPCRLKDPTNLDQLLQIENKYPYVKLIVAHVGRAYCLEDIGNAFEVLKDTKNMLFDISANTNADVFKLLIDAIGPKRILFGSDMPITRMRMKRIYENGKYINIIPKGLYGDVSNDKNMQEVESSQAENLTLFIYEEIDAFKKAAKETKLTKNDIADVFYNNAYKLITSTKNN